MLTGSDAYKAADGTILSDGRFSIRRLKPFSHIRVKAHYAPAAPDFDIMRINSTLADSFADFPDGDEITKTFFQEQREHSDSSGGAVLQRKGESR